jgi:hypothetical protein
VQTLAPEASETNPEGGLGKPSGLRDELEIQGLSEVSKRFPQVPVHRHPMPAILIPEGVQTLVVAEDFYGKFCSATSIHPRIIDCNPTMAQDFSADGVNFQCGRHIAQRENGPNGGPFSVFAVGEDLKGARRSLRPEHLGGSHTMGVDDLSLRTVEDGIGDVTRSAYQVF